MSPLLDLLRLMCLFAENTLIKVFQILIGI
jgi:hypothetical protein